MTGRFREPSDRLAQLIVVVVTPWLRQLHPLVLKQRWEWRGLRLDPTRLPVPLKSPGERDFIITGCPRTGTSLLGAALFQPPTCITLVEPWAGMRAAPAALFSEMRAQISSSGRVDVGTLDFDALSRGEVRRCSEGSSATEVEIAESTLLGIKWPSFFRYLALLPDTKFVVCMRHPFEVLRSMERIGGSLQRGQDYDLPFNRAMNRELRARAADAALRRIEMFDYVHERILPYLEAPNVFAVRYERWWTDPHALVAELGAFLSAELRGPAIEIRDEKPVDLDEDTKRFIRRHSRMAHRLGYSLA